jgi:hypothetical protein
MTTVKDVQAHGGRFDVDEISRWATRSPAILVSVLGIPDTEHEGVAEGNIRMAAFIVTAGTSATLRDANALSLAETVTAHAVNNLWNYADAHAPQNVTAQNLYSSALDKKLRVALWAVTWTQRADLSIPDEDDFDNLYDVQTNYENFPVDGVTDFSDTIQIRGTYMSYYGHIYASTAVGTLISVADTYQKLAGTTTLKLADEFDMPVVGRLRHTGGVARPCKMSASGSLTVSADAKVTVALAEDGVVDANTEQEIEMTLAGGAQSFNLEGILSLDTNEYAEVWVKADDTITVTATKLNLVAAAT